MAPFITTELLYSYLADSLLFGSRQPGLRGLQASDPLRAQLAYRLEGPLWKVDCLRGKLLRLNCNNWAWFWFKCMRKARMAKMLVTYSRFPSGICEGFFQHST